MKTLIYYIPHSSFFSKYPYGRVTHALGVINGFATNGVKVTVIAEEGILSFINRIDKPSEVTFITVPAYSYWAHFQLLIKIKQVIRDLNDDKVFMYRKTLFGLLWILLFRVINKKVCKVVSEVNGFVLDYKQTFQGRYINKWFELLHKIILRSDDFVYVVNEDLKSKLVSGLFSISKERVIVVHNGGPSPHNIEFSANTQDIIRLVFFGILADYNELELFIDAVKEIDKAQKKIYLDIVGFGPKLESLQKAANCVEGVSFYGEMNFLSFIELIESLQLPCVGIVPMKIGNNKNSLSPIKAFDYMSLGMPLIYSDLCLDGIVKDGVHGFVYKNGQIDSLIGAIEKLLVKENWSSIQNYIKNDYTQHTWASRMKTLDKLIF